MHDDAYLELCAAHALGCLDPADAARLHAHLASGCEPCHEEMTLHRDTVERLGQQLPAQQVPEGAEESLMKRIEGSESAPGTTRGAGGRIFPPWTLRIAAVLAVGVAGWMVVDRGLTINRLSGEVEDLQKATAEIQRVVLRGTEHAPEAVGYAYTDQHEQEDASDDELIFHVSNLMPCEEGKVYTAWATSDGKAEEVGTVRPDETGEGYSTLRMPSHQSPFQLHLTLESVTHAADPAGPVVLKHTPPAEQP